MKMTVFWDVAPCSLVEISRRNIPEDDHLRDTDHSSLLVPKSEMRVALPLSYRFHAQYADTGAILPLP
jgi:hypothetical protein